MSEHLELETYNTRGSGVWFRARAGENIAIHDLVYVGADGLFYRADADAAATMPAIGLAIWPIPLGLYGEVLSKGFIGDTAWAWTAGGELYVSATVGALTQTVPVAPALTQQVGIALTATQIWFDSEGITGVGIAAGCPILEGSTAYVGFDACKEPFANYFLCDGVADELQINQAEAYVVLNRGGTVELEAGTYDIINPIVTTGDYVWYKGQGDTTILDGDGLATTEHIFHVTAMDNIRISDMSMMTEDGGGKTCHCIFIEDGSNNFLIENITIWDSDSDGIHIEGTTITEGHVHNCKILDADDNGIQVDMDNSEYMYYLKITECEIAGAGERGILLTNGNSNHSYYVIQDNTIHGSTLDGIYAWDLEYSTIGGNVLYDNDNHGIILNSGGRTTVVNNTITRSGFHGIYLVNMGYCTVDGNIILYSDFEVTNTYDGINIGTSCNYITVSNNQLEDNRRYGIYTGAPNTIVDGNGVALSQFHGIVIDDVDCVCSNNIVDDNSQETAGTYHGIVLTADADRTVVEGNTCSSPNDSQEDGIHLEDGAINVLIEGNYCYFGMGSGIMLVAGNDDCFIEGNYLRENDDYGLEITAASSDNVFIGDNYITGNGAGDVNDNGTDTWTSMNEVEAQAGIIAEPTVEAWTSGHEVDVFNTTETRYFKWLQLNNAWQGVELL